LNSIRHSRRVIQWAVALLFLAVPLLNLTGRHFLSGNLLSFSFGPLTLADPLAVLQAYAATLSGTTAMFLAFGISLLCAFLLGSVFCSWLCPYGLFSEIAHSLGWRVGGLRRIRQGTGSAKAALIPFVLKAGIVCAGLALVALYCPVPLLNQLSMPGWYTRALQKAIQYREFLWGAVLPATALLVEIWTGKRWWCRYVCPQSVLISLAGLLLPARLRIGFIPRACACGKERPCLQACSLGLNPRKTNAAQRLQCTNCGDCVDACRRRGGALRLAFGQSEEI
jgi:ferredoxin-type protein NapH